MLLLERAHTDHAGHKVGLLNTKRDARVLETRLTLRQGSLLSSTETLGNNDKGYGGLQDRGAEGEVGGRRDSGGNGMVSGCRSGPHAEDWTLADVP